MSIVPYFQAWIGFLKLSFKIQKKEEPSFSVLKTNVLFCTFVSKRLFVLYYSLLKTP